MSFVLPIAVDAQTYEYCYSRAEIQNWCYTGYTSVTGGPEGETDEYCEYTSLESCDEALNSHPFDIPTGNDTCFPDVEYTASGDPVGGEELCFETRQDCSFALNNDDAPATSLSCDEKVVTGGGNDNDDGDGAPTGPPPSEGGDYTPLAPLPGTTQGGVAGDDAGFAGFVNGAMRLVIGIASVLAVLMLVIAGFQYMSTDAATGKMQGKERMLNALGGLVLALAAFLILNTINPQLVEIHGVERTDPISVRELPSIPGWYYYDSNNRVRGPYPTEEACDQRRPEDAESCFPVGSDTIPESHKYCLFYETTTIHGLIDCKPTLDQCRDAQSYYEEGGDIVPVNLEVACSYYDNPNVRGWSYTYVTGVWPARFTREVKYPTQESCKIAQSKNIHKEKTECKATQNTVLIEEVLADEDNVRVQIEGAGITIKRDEGKPAGEDGRCVQYGQRACTNVGLLPNHAIAGLKTIKEECDALYGDCRLSITGGTEYWLHKTHGPRKGIVDLEENISSAGEYSNLEKYILSKKGESSVPSFRVPNNFESFDLPLVMDSVRLGVVRFTYEHNQDPHWHVCFSNQIDISDVDNGEEPCDHTE